MLQEFEKTGHSILVKKEALSETKAALIETNQLELCIPLPEANIAEIKAKQIPKKKRRYGLIYYNYFNNIHFWKSAKDRNMFASHANNGFYHLICVI